MNRKNACIFFRFVGLLLLQGLVLNKLNLFGFINPMTYIAFVFLQPFKREITGFLVSCFLLGLGVDFFSDTGGIHASSIILIAALRLHFLRLFGGKLDLDHQTISIYDISPFARLYFMISLTILHHFAMFSLAYFSMSNIVDILSNTLVTSIATIVFIYLGLIIFARK